MAQPQTYKAVKTSHTSQGVSSRRKKSETPTIPAVKHQWVEDSPSYLDGVLATLETLTDEDKEAIHLSLQR